MAKKQIKDVIAEINKKHGDDSVKIITKKHNIKSFSTGSIKFDKILGIDGLPYGKIVEIYGGESTGKTTLAIMIMKALQHQKKSVAFIDTEHAFDPDYAKTIGLDLNNMIFSQPDSAEAALDLVEDLIKTNAVDLIVLDSVAALSPKKELEGTMEDQDIGLLPRLMGKALRKIRGIANETKTCVAFINQTRSKVGVYYGNPETTSGGRALKFFSTMRIEVKSGKPIVEKNEPIGKEMVLKIVKNKVAPPMKKTTLKLYFGQGISFESELIDYGIAAGFLIKSGTWFADGESGETIVQGETKMREYLLDNPEYSKELKTKIDEYLIQLRKEKEQGEIDG